MCSPTTDEDLLRRCRATLAWTVDHVERRDAESRDEEPWGDDRTRSCELSAAIDLLTELDGRLTWRH